MKNKLLLLLSASLALSACSELTTKEAPIEDRTAGIATGSATGGVAGAGMSSGSGSGVEGQGTGGAGASAGQDGVQTHGALADGVQVTPLPAQDGEGSGAGGAAGAGTGGLQGGAMSEAALAEKYAELRVPPRDAQGPLAERTILFDFDSSVIKDEYRGLIEAHALFLRSSKHAKSILQGHTDERGSRDYNLALGQRRAESVQQALVLLGVDPARIESVSLGEEKPALEGHDEAAWSQNRRVELYYQGE